MEITDFQKSVLVRLVLTRLDGGPHYRTYGDIARMLGKDPSSQALAVAGALDTASEWFAAQALPDVTTTIISKENADKFLMLPPQKIIDRFGGEAGVRAEADRVRDFDWLGWLES